MDWFITWSGQREARLILPTLIREFQGEGRVTLVLNHPQDVGDVEDVAILSKTEAMKLGRPKGAMLGLGPGWGSAPVLAERLGLPWAAYGGQGPAPGAAVHLTQRSRKWGIPVGPLPIEVASDDPYQYYRLVRQRPLVTIFPGGEIPAGFLAYVAGLAEAIWRRDPTAQVSLACEGEPDEMETRANRLWKGESCLLESKALITRSGKCVRVMWNRVQEVMALTDVAVTLPGGPCLELTVKGIPVVALREALPNWLADEPFLPEYQPGLCDEAAQEVWGILQDRWRWESLSGYGRSLWGNAHAAKRLLTEMKKLTVGNLHPLPVGPGSH